MKKIIYVFLAFCFMGIAFADIDFSEAINNSTMPTDAEIRHVISQFDFNQEQQDEVFKYTKKKLREIYSTNNMSQTNAELNRYYNQINDENVSQYMNNSVKNQLKRDISKLPKNSSSSARSVKSATYSQNQNKGFQSKKFELNESQD